MLFPKSLTCPCLLQPSNQHSDISCPIEKIKHIYKHPKVSRLHISLHSHTSLQRVIGTNYCFLFNSLIGMTMTSVTPGTQLPWHSCVVSCSLLIKETSYHWNKDSHLRTKRLLYVCEWSSLSTQGGLLPESTLVPKSRDAQVPS